MLCTMGVAQPKRETPIKNPMLWADVPDPDVIRVDDTFYLVSTTMHLMPGATTCAFSGIAALDSPAAEKYNKLYKSYLLYRRVKQ